MTYHERRVFIGRHVSGIICKDLHLKCFKRCRAQELTDANCAARVKRAKLLLQKLLQYATDFTDEEVFSVVSPDNQQNDRVYAPRDTRKRSIAATRILLKKIAMLSYA